MFVLSVDSVVFVNLQNICNMIKNVPIFVILEVTYRLELADYVIKHVLVVKGLQI